MMEFRRGKIVFFGNCQAQWLYFNFQLAAKSAALENEYEFRYVLSPAPEALDQLKHEIPEACALIFQITRDLPAPPDDVVRALNGEVFRLPALYFKTFWPHDGHDPRNQPEHPKYPAGYCPRGDVYVNRLLQKGVAPDEIYQRYMSEDLAKTINLDRLMELEIARFRLQEKHCDLKFLDVVESDFRRLQLFSMTWHPTILFYQRTVHQLWDFLDLPETMRERSMFILGTGKIEPNIPIHPSVAAHFQLQWAEAPATYSYFGSPMTFSDWLRAYIHHRPWPKPA